MTDELDDTFRLVGSVVAGRYAVERVVVRGGFGLVYKATHLELAAPVALKVLVIAEHLRGGSDATLVEQFRQEARTLATLKHPAIVRVLDVGSLDPADASCVWMALEWLDGATLDEDLRARAGRRRSPREALSLLAPAFDAIASAHDQGIAHRDLKPANLMLSPDGRGGASLRVLDFGIAKVMAPDERPGSGQTETRGDFSAFSLRHAAPEQVGRARTGPWTDAHALGLLVTELLASRRAYEGDETFDLYGAVMSRDRPTPARLGIDVGPWEPVLRKAMALHPSERFASAGELHAALSSRVDEAQRSWDHPQTSASAPAPRYALGVAAVVAASALLVIGVRVTRAPPTRVPTRVAVAPSAFVKPRPPSHVDAAFAPPDVAVVALPAPPSPRVTPRRPTVPRARTAPPDIAGDSDPEVVIE